MTKRPSNYPLSVQTDEKFYEGVCEIANRLGDIVAELREIITVVGDQIDEVFVIPNGEFGRWEE